MKKILRKIMNWIMRETMETSVFDSEVIAIQTWNNDLVIATKSGRLYVGKPGDWKVY